VAQGYSLPAANPPERWPREHPPGATARGTIDGFTNPAPSGGAAHPVNGFDAVHAYRIRVPSRSRVVARLTITGSGRVADRADLDLELRDLRTHRLAASAGEDPVEAIDHAVDAGSYVLFVRDGGRGNRAAYALSYTLAPSP
jgi:hypothetical protein